MDNNIQRTIDAASVFGDRLLNTKQLYLERFGTLPSIHFINGIDGEKAYAAFKEAYGHLIVSEYNYRWWKGPKRRYAFDETVLLLRNQCIVELNSYCEILHNGAAADFIDSCTALMSRFRERRKREPLEINLIVKGGYGLELKPMEIKRTKLDIDLYYEDSFAAVDSLIRKRLNAKKDKGIVLLHGLPGTGKTTYLRYLVGKLRKRVLFLSPIVAANLMDPEFIEMLINNPETVVIIEDAEHIITDRRYSANGSVSNLLNISDGLLADFLNVQLVCTFNSPLTTVDPALLRKGRLIAQYAFGKLGVQKAQQLSEHLQMNRVITEPMTVAEICHADEANFETKKVEVIGFKRSFLEN